MAIDFESLSKPLPKKGKIKLWRWFALLIIFFLIGFIATLSYGYFFGISDFWFICCSGVTPFLLWSFCFVYKIYIRFYNNIYIEEWNYNCEKEHQHLIEFAKRGLYVVSHSLETSHGKYGNGVGVAESKLSLSTKPAGNHGLFFKYGSLTVPENIYPSDIPKRTELLFNNWLPDYQLILNQLSSQLKLHVRIFIDTQITTDELESIWLKTFGKFVKPTSFEINDSATSTTFIESWLDNSDYDSDLLLVINAHLFQSPTENEGEFASVILFAGEEAIEDPLLSDFKARTVKVHRSEQTSTLTETLDKALLWGEDNQSDYDGIWTSQVSEEQNKSIMMHLNDIQFKLNNFFDVDFSIGSVRNCAYWLSLALAVENSQENRKKQLVLIGKPNVTAFVVAFPNQS
ncbi:hypothetical protein B6D16_07880 [Gilliamella apicola]|uniref:hypothetical protein n=1 Tax=Gilliamella apicola TaxID=1196095 RepID=UPI000A3307E3|nr:hypothetical protein [Gilliamella apicola]OTP96633.1 hypothetical protein B6D05_03975 [Gilliamella apicola]OTQ17397.1 hypothetical protein B6D15_07325 [Gilliamella apicola]OTQ17635.1 hypothetical protein B6D16_07880 [Gilliamella apicola]OTQ24233.1 hypothetical protein B6D04_05935 [Gilliamella apicola]